MRTIDVSGSDENGNAHALMCYAKTFAEQLGLDGKAIVAEMTTGNYVHLIDVFERHFGHVVILYRSVKTY